MTKPTPLSPPLAVSDKSTEANKTGTWRFEKPVFVERAAPCNEACPLGQDINEIMVLQSRGEVGAALAAILRENPFPGLCGLGCPAPCERACNRGRLDAPVSIRGLESFAAENGADAPALAPVKPSGLSVAVVGQGLAALSCAWFLIHLGHRVTLLANGTGWTGNPDLAKVWDRERAGIIAAGVEEIKPDRAAPDPAALAEKFDGLFLEPGSGPDLGGGAVFRSRDFLRRAKADASIIGKQPVVVGQGDRAAKTAAFLIEVGLEPVVISNSPQPVEVDLFGRAKAHWSTEVMGLKTASGRIEGLACRRDGREFTLEADQVILCLGQRNDPDFQPPLLLAGAVAAAPVLGQGENLSVAQLIALGKGAALGLDLGLRQLPLQDIDRAAVGRRGALSLAGWLEADSARQRSEVVPFQDLNLSWVEVSGRHGQNRPRELPNPAKARAEARRCLNCGFCNLCGKCEEFCPDLSVDIDPTAGTRTLDYDHCKGCGICVEECPRGAVVMGPE